VGIGTTVPLAKLHVNGNTIVSSLTAPGGNYLTISNGAGSGAISLRGNDITTSGGYVGIGTDTPLARLHVNGTFFAPGVPIQIVTIKSTATTSSSSTTYIITNASASITPRFSTSLLIVEFFYMYSYNSTVANSGIWVQIRRDGVEDITNVGSNGNSESFIYSSMGGSSSDHYGKGTTITTYTAGSTNQTTFTLWAKTFVGSFWIGTANSYGRNVIKITEVAT
jgi:hypothetical protein